MAKVKNNGRLQTERLPENVFEGKIPPYSSELEMNILGGLIIDNNLIDYAMSVLKPGYFYDTRHQMLFSAICEMRDRREPIDLLTLTEEMRSREELDKIGGPAFLAELASSFISLEGMEFASNKVIEFWVRRGLINLNFEIREQCFDLTVSIEKLLDKSQHEILDITNYIQRKNFSHLKTEVSNTMDYVEIIHERHEKGANVFGVPSGYDQLDDLTGGFQKSELIILAGRPSMGKTALALNFARNAAVDHGRNIGIFSIEMSNRELALRFICLESKVDISNLKTGRIKDEDWEKIMRTTPKLMSPSSKVNIFIDDSSPLSMLELRAKARRMKAIHNIDMVIVDYLQLMDVTSSRRIENRYIEIGLITRGLKQLSKELDIPVLALSQLSRKVEERAGKEKRPQLSDLRESGSIEQDADVVIFINRPELYMSKDDVKYNDFYGLAEVIIGKQRNGPIGEAKLTFRHNYAKFENRAKDNVPTYYAPQETPF